MKICYREEFNFNLGLLNHLHPFDGMKFKRVYDLLRDVPNLNIGSPPTPISEAVAAEFVDDLIKLHLADKVLVLRALEFPNLPFISFSFISRKVLLPMRWGVAGTITSTRHALAEGACWNLSGGYHHASQHRIEGFCIYNDIGICYQELIKDGTLLPSDKILIIDTDAHHGNGNARTFIDNSNVTILDVFNERIYPTTYSTRNRVDYPVPLQPGTEGEHYLESYQQALASLPGDFRVAFVVAGTDVLAVDKLGGLKLTEEDVVKREQLTLRFLRDRGIPAVVLSGGGYSKASAACIAQAIKTCSRELSAATGIEGRRSFVS